MGRSGIVKGFGTPARLRRRGSTEADVRKASREETAGEFIGAKLTLGADTWMFGLHSRRRQAMMRMIVGFD